MGSASPDLEVLQLEQYPLDQGTHKVEILQRESVRLTGVIHVESFDERQVVVETEMGMLALMGEEFHIKFGPGKRADDPGRNAFVAGVFVS